MQVLGMNQNSLGNKTIFDDGEKQPPNNNSKSQGRFGPNVAKKDSTTPKKIIVSSSIRWALPKQFPAWKMMGKCNKNHGGRNPPIDHYQNEFPSLGKLEQTGKTCLGEWRKMTEGKSTV